MIYPELNEVLQALTHTLNVYNSSDIVIGVQEQMSRFSEYLKLLDIDGIDFRRKDYYAEQRVKAYWMRFTQLAMGLKDCLDSFSNSEIALNAAIMSLRQQISTAMGTVAMVKAKGNPMALSDIEGSTQILTVENLINTLNMKVTEFEGLLAAVEQLHNLGGTTFNYAILKTVSERGTATLSGLGMGYAERFREVQHLVSLYTQSNYTPISGGVAV